MVVNQFEKRLDKCEQRIEKMEEQITMIREFTAISGEKIEDIPEIKKAVNDVNVETKLNSQTLGAIKKILYWLLGLFGSVITALIVAGIIALI